MDHTPESAKLLKHHILSFINFVGEVLSDPKYNFVEKHHGDLLLMQHLIERSDALKLMNLFVIHILPYSEQIKNKNEDFFKNNISGIFGELPPDKVQFVYDLIENDMVSLEDKEFVWQYWIIFIGLVEKYKKNK